MKSASYIRVVICLILLASAFLYQSASAQDSSPGYTLQQLTLKGTGKPVVQPVPSNINPESPVTEYFSQRPDIDYPIPRISSQNPLSATQTAKKLSVPNVQGSEVISGNDAKGASGFNGLAHADQRQAGTDQYTNTQFSAEPPDQALCVGNGFVVEWVNTILSVYDTSGKILAGPTALNQFFGLTPEVVRSTPPIFGDFTSDPKCLYDPATGQFYLTLLQINVDPASGNMMDRSHVLIAVSKTKDPTGDWNFFMLDTSDNGKNGTPNHPGCSQGCLGDQPLIGLDANGFYISTNEFSMNGNTFNGAQLYAIAKAPIASGSLPPAVVHLDNLNLAEGQAYTLQPGNPPDAKYENKNNGTIYFLSALDFNASLDNRIAVWSLTNTASLLSDHPGLKLQHAILDSEVYGQPPVADQKSGSTPLAADPTVNGSLETIDTNDDRMNQVSYADGLLYSGVNTIMNVDGQQKAGIAFFGVKPYFSHGKLNADLVQQCYLGVAGNNVYFPSIGVTDDGNAAMVYTLSGVDFYPSAAYSLLDDSNPVKVQVAAEGKEPEDGFSGYEVYQGDGSARWGDYSAAVTDGSTIWMATEYIPGGQRTMLANWGTFIIKVTP